MKALRIHAPGGGDRLRYEDADDPQLGSPSDVIVKLAAAAVSPLDVAPRTDVRCRELPFPHIPGADGAGTVASMGAEVSNVKPGDAVCIYPLLTCGQCRFCTSGQESGCDERRLLGAHEDGTYAEYVRVPAKNCFVIPAGLTFDEAAAFPLVYTTAWRMLFTHADLKPGESVLIIGAGGGIATAALQLAEAAAARVFVASHNRGKLAAVTRSGAHHGIDCPIEELAGEVRRLTAKRGVDVVVNSVGGSTWRAGLAALARGGRLVTCGAAGGGNPKTDLRRVFWNHLKIFAAGSPAREEFRRVWDFFDGTGRRPLIDRVFPLREAQAAHQRLQRGEQVGKIILRIDA